MNAIIPLHAPFLCAIVDGSAARAALERSSDHDFRWLIISSCAVALGVGLEFFQGRLELIRWWKLRKGLDVPVNETSWTIPVSFLGLLLVVVGVVGEGISEALVSRVETKIRSFDSQRITEAEAGANKALCNAQKAQGAADAGIRRSKTALDEASDGVALAKSDELRASRLEKEAASLQHAVLLQLPREEILAQKSRLDLFESALRPFAGQKIEVRYPAKPEFPMRPVDGETDWFAFALSNDLSQASWITLGPILDVPWDHGTGIFITVTKRSSQRTRDAADALAKALTNVPLVVRPALLSEGLYKGSLVAIGDRSKRFPQPNGSVFPPFEDETIVVDVAPHP